jgi:hypothetical protein
VLVKFIQQWEFYLGVLCLPQKQKGLIQVALGFWLITGLFEAINDLSRSIGCFADVMG